MIEQPSQQPTSPSVSSRVLGKALLVFGTLLVAGIAIALGLYFGRRIYGEDWAILITVTGLATYIAIAVIDARHALLFWIVTAPFARFTYLNFDPGRGIPSVTLNRLMTGVLLVLVLAQLAIRRRKAIRLTAVDVFLLIYCGAAALSVPSAVVGLNSAMQSFLDLVIIPIAVYFLARNLITNGAQFKGVMIALLIIGLYFGFLATREQLTGNIWFYPEDRSVQYSRDIRRVVGLLGNPAFIAVTISMAVPWTLYLFINARKHKLFYLGAVALMIAGVFFCMNRSGWVGLALAFVVMGLFMRRFRKYFVMLLAVSAMVGITYWALITSSNVWRQRLQAQGPIEYRVQTWNVALSMIKDNPLFGIGYENFQFFYKRYAIWDIYLRAMPTPHNTYLWVMLMGGMAAFIPFIAFLGAVFLAALGLYLKPPAEEGFFPDRDLTVVFVASMISILAPAAVMDVMTGYYNTMIMFFIMGAFFGAVAGERRQQDKLWARARRHLGEHSRLVKDSDGNTTEPTG